MNALLLPIPMVLIQFFLFNRIDLFHIESIPYLVNLLHEAISSADRRSNGLEARELCKGLSKLSVAENNKFKVSCIDLSIEMTYLLIDLFRSEIIGQCIEYA